MKAIRQLTGFGAMQRLRAHVGVGVRRHLIPELVWVFAYDVSEKHFEPNLHVICIAVSLSVTIMVA
jgi:hypothetical protein